MTDVCVQESVLKHQKLRRKKEENKDRKKERKKERMKEIKKCCRLLSMKHLQKSIAYHLKNKTKTKHVQVNKKQTNKRKKQKI